MDWSSNRVKGLFPVLVLVLLGVAVYANTLGNQFVLDDNAYIVDNYYLRDLGNLYQFVDVPANATIEDLPPGFLKGRNVRWFTYAFDYALGGGRPLAFHLTNLLLHLAVGLLGYRLLLKWGIGRLPAVAAAALFLAHPIQTAAVSYISGRKDLLAALFVVATLLAVERYRAQRRLPWLVGACLAFAFALFSKESAIILPALLFWVDSCRQPVLDRAGFRKVLVEHHREYLVLGGMALLFFLHLKGWGGQGLAGAMTAGSELAANGNSPENRSYANLMLFYLWKLCWPLNLLADYRGAFTFDLYPASWGKPVSAGFIALVIAAVRWLQPRRWEIACGLGWVLMALLPVSHLIPFHYPVAEHYLYLPAFGFCCALAGALQFAGSDRRLLAAAVLLAVVYGGLTIERNRDWRDMETVTADILKKAPHHQRARNTLVHLLIEKGRYSEALEQARVALAADPTSAITYFNLGVACENLNRIDEAVRHYRQALSLQPNLWDAYLNLGNLLLVSGRGGEGKVVLEQLLQRYGFHPLAYWVLGSQAAREGDWLTAQQNFATIIRMDRHSAVGYLGLAGAARSLGASGDWQGYLQQALDKGLDVEWARGQQPWGDFLQLPDVAVVLGRSQLPVAGR